MKKRIFENVPTYFGRRDLILGIQLTTAKNGDRLQILSRFYQAGRAGNERYAMLANEKGYECIDEELLKDKTLKYLLPIWKMYNRFNQHDYCSHQKENLVKQLHSLKPLVFTHTSAVSNDDFSDTYTVFISKDDSLPAPKQGYRYDPKMQPLLTSFIPYEDFSNFNWLKLPCDICHHQIQLSHDHKILPKDVSLFLKKL